MTVLLYAVVDAAAPPPSGHGLSGRPLRTIDRGSLRAVVSEHDSPPAPDTDTYLAYEAVMEELMAQCALLPARFGTTAETEEQVLTLLDTRAAELRRGLERVAGAVELAVHLPQPDTTDTKPQSGTEYMRARLQDRRRSEALSQATSGLYRHTAPTPHSTAYLVDAGRIDQFVRQVSELGATVTGPWPPYSFVEQTT